MRRNYLPGMKYLSSICATKYVTNPHIVCDRKKRDQLEYYQFSVGWKDDKHKCKIYRFSKKG